jgi:rare lipoprotein A (peptidoglycan hydrolase)
MTTPALDPSYRSDGALTEDSVLLHPAQKPAPAGRPDAAAIQPTTKAGVVVVSAWHLDSNVSWYGPGFYGKRTACGHAYTESIIGVAHKTLPCGTKVTFKNPANGRVVTAPVIDRGPYVAGRQWDLSGGLCKALNHCYTGSLYWKMG